MTDLVEVIRAGIATVQTISPDRDVVVECAAETWVFADPNILGRVVENLVVNGVKHAPAATPVVVSVADERGTVTVSVRDEGPGIPPELQEKIFEKFGVVRARYKYGSVGLGLTFCKLAVEAHGGQIGLESEEGQGSTFWFEITAPVLEEMSAASLEDFRDCLKGRRILIVDDYALNLDLFSDYLAVTGADIRGVSCAADAPSS